MIMIFRNEIKKIFRFTAIYIFLAVFTTINILYIYKLSINDDFNKELKYAKKTAENYGSYIDDNFKKNYYDDYILSDSNIFSYLYEFKLNRELDTGNPEKLQKQVNYFAECLITGEIELTEDENEMFKSFNGKITYYMKNIYNPDYSYKAIDKESKRINDIIETGECNYYFAPKIFKPLLNDLFGLLLIEGYILCTLIVPYILHYEFDSNTHSVVYCSNKGRNINNIKLISGAIASLVLFILITVLTVIVYLVVFDLFYLFDVPVCNRFFGSGSIYPMVTYSKTTFIALITNYAIVAIFLNILFSLISSAISNVVINSYVCYTINIISVLILYICFVVADNKVVNGILCSSPYIMALNRQDWFQVFNAKSDLKPFYYFEPVCVLFWFVILIVMLYITHNIFRKKDLL